MVVERTELQMMKLDANPTLGLGIPAKRDVLGQWDSGAITYLYKKTGDAHNAWTLIRQYDSASHVSDFDEIVDKLPEINDSATVLQQTWSSSKIAAAIAASSPNISFSNIYYLDINTTVPTLEQNGSLGKPYKTISQIMTALGQPIDAADFQKNIAIISLTRGTTTEDITVPHRAITIIANGLKIVGSITREISNEKEYGVSSSVWRGTFSIIAPDGEAWNNHQLNRQGIIITGNVRTRVIATETGNTTHDAFYKGVKFEGIYTADDGVVNGAAPSVGNHVTYATDCLFNEIEGRQIYMQDLVRTHLKGDTIVGWLIRLSDCRIRTNAPWEGAAVNLNLTVSQGLDSGDVNFAESRWINTDIKSVLATVPAGQTIYVDDITNYIIGGALELTWVTNTPTINQLS